MSEHFDIELRWIPFILRIKGKGERSQYSEWKARYSYMDARRWANRRGGFPIKGPLKVYDSSAALIGGLYAMRHGFFRPYTEMVYSRFFKRELEIDLPEQITAIITELGHDAEGHENRCDPRCQREVARVSSNDECQRGQRESGDRYSPQHRHIHRTAR